MDARLDQNMHGAARNDSAAQNPAKVIDVTEKGAGAFAHALDELPPGSFILYHVGAYCGGRYRDAAWEAYEAGLVQLCLKKQAAGLFAYYAVIRKDRGRA